MVRTTSPRKLLVGAALLASMVAGIRPTGADAAPSSRPVEPQGPAPSPGPTCAGCPREEMPDGTARRAQDPHDPATDRTEGAPRSGLARYLERIELDGSVEGYYGWNFNEAPTKELRNFDVNHDQMTFSLAEVVLQNKAVPQSRVGFRLDLGGGPTADMVNASEPGGPNFLKALHQGYASYLAPLGKGVLIDVGKFSTPLGAEVVKTRENWNLSRSLLFTLAVPYYHVGARAAYEVSPRLAVTGLVVNGWNAAQDNNRAKSFGLSVSLEASPRLTITQNVMVGAEQADNTSDLRQVFNTVASYTMTPRMSLLADAVYGRDTVGTARPEWFGIAVAGRYQVTPRCAVAPRYEWYSDEDGLTTGLGQIVQEVTLTSEYRLRGVLARAELRTDVSSQPFFPSAGTVRRTRTTATIGVLYAFAWRK